MKKCVTILFVLVLAMSCSSTGGSEQVVQSFELQPERILEEELGSILYVVGPYLLAKQHQQVPDREVFHAYDLKTLKFLGGVGMRGGQAPNTFYGVVYGGQAYKENDDWVVWVNDPPRSRINALNITQSLKTGESVFKESIMYRQEHDLNNLLFVLEDQVMLGHQPGFQPGTNKSPFVIMSNGSLENFGEYPEIKNFPTGKKWQIQRNRINRVVLVAKPDLSKVATLMRNYNLLTIYSKDGKILYRHGPKSGQEEYSVEITSGGGLDFGDVKTFYSYAASTDDYIFALYQDQKKEKPKIRVFNWKAELVYELILPFKISSLSIDRENQILYAGSLNTEGLYRFSLNEFME